MGFGYAGKLIEESDQVVWKCEGLSDVLSLLSLGLPDHHTAVTNGCGATERPARSNEWFSRKLSGKEVFVIHDCDRPGQDGAIGDDKKPGWAPAIARHAAIVRNVVLPYPIAESRGKDLRDWIGDRRSEGKDNPTIYAELIDYARRAKQIHPLGADLPAETEADRSGDFADDDSGPDAANQDGKDAKKPLEHPDDPHRLARINLARYEDEHGGALKYWRQEWWKYKSGRYQKILHEDLHAKVTAAVKAEFDSLWQEENERYEEWVNSDAYNEKTDKGPPKVRKVTKSLIDNVISSLKSLCLMTASVDMPSWIPTRSNPNFVSMANGILSLDELFKGDEADQDKIVIPHSEDWFSTLKLPYAFDPSALCPRWLNFLDDVFNGDEESIEALKRWFGYQLTNDNRLQKMLFVIGQPRSGKGTIMRAMIGMLGKNSIASPSLGNLGQPFGLDALMGKSVAVISDARLSKRHDEVEITEKLLKIVGDDPVDIARKHTTTLTSIHLPTRFSVFTNQVPKLSDSSSAFPTRCIFVSMPNSYKGRENVKLGDEILGELPGILNWAIAGKYALEQAIENGEREKIKEPRSAADVRRRMTQTIAPVAFFINEQCVLQSDVSIGVQELFEAWCDWSRENNFANKMTVQSFSRKLHDALPNVETARPREDGGRIREFVGISLKKENSF